MIPREQQYVAGFHLEAQRLAHRVGEASRASEVPRVPSIGVGEDEKAVALADAAHRRPQVDRVDARVVEECRWSRGAP